MNSSDFKNGHLVTRSGRHLNRAKLFKKPPKFQFMKLPGEIRNKIYNLLLISETDKVIVTDMGCWEYCRRARWGPLRRSAFETIEHPRMKLSSYTCMTGFHRAERSNGPSKFRRWQGLQVLFLNREIYEEAHTIFYSSNNFFAVDLTAFLVFCQDRSPTARLSIQNLTFMLHTSRQNYQDRLSELLVALKVFSTDLQLKNLTVIIDNWEPHYSLSYFRDKDNPGWLHQLSDIKDLETFDLKLPSAASSAVWPAERYSVAPAIPLKPEVIESRRSEVERYFRTSMLNHQRYLEMLAKESEAQGD